MQPFCKYEKFLPLADIHALNIHNDHNCHVTRLQSLQKPCNGQKSMHKMRQVVLNPCHKINAVVLQKSCIASTTYTPCNQHTKLKKIIPSLIWIARIFVHAADVPDPFLGKIVRSHYSAASNAEPRRITSLSFVPARPVPLQVIIRTCNVFPAVLALVHHSS